MHTHTRRSIVEFSDSFALRGVNLLLPPGAYTIVEVEHRIEGMMWLSFPQVVTFIQLPARCAATATEHLVEIDAEELEAALKQDFKKQHRAYHTSKESQCCNTALPLDKKPS